MDCFVAALLAMTDEMQFAACLRVSVKMRARPLARELLGQPAAVLHHALDPSHGANVFERIPLDEHEVGQLAGFDRPDTLLDTEKLRAFQGCGDEDLRG